MKKLIFSFFIILLYACGREETSLLVPYAEPKPPRVLNIVKEELNCSMPFNVRFMAQLSNELGNESYQWDIGGVQYSGRIPTVSINQTGDVKVTLKVSNPVGADQFNVTFNYASNTLPVLPDFNYGAENNNYRIPAILNFNDLSQRATGVSWDFGDGYQSNLRNPQHIYNFAGKYTITLTAWCDSDTAQQTAVVTILAEPRIIRFDRFEIMEFPNNYFPENSDDNTKGGDFYVELGRNNFKYGSGIIMNDKSKLPVFWRCPQEWNGDYRLIFYTFGNYQVSLWDKNNTNDVELMNAVFDGNYLKNNYYPNQLDFQSGDLQFRIFLNYED